jgi:uncharacterized DUF497 family protein
MAVIYQWDARKAAANLKKHGLSFEDAATVFSGCIGIDIPDRIIQWTSSARLQSAIL